MLRKINEREIILASRSPRRRQLLEGMGLKIIVDVVDTDEIVPSGMDPKNVAEWLAREKADAYPDEKLKDHSLLIAADTIVVLGNDILGKPKHEKEAFEMLRNLSGKEHIVITAVCLKDLRHSSCFSVQSRVSFKHLHDDEIAYYIKECKPYDKAGAYGIQEWIGIIGIERIEGSYYNVMGMPTFRLWEELLIFIKT